MKDFTAAPLGDIEVPMGTLESLRKRCQQHLVALFTPAMYPGRNNVPMGTMRNRAKGSARIAWTA